jgi:quercetin dioxygenase-like cupin family protein
MDEKNKVIVTSADTLPKKPVQAGSGTSMQILIGSADAPNFAMRRFIMEPGGGMPNHTNCVEHEQFVLRGKAKIGIGEVVYAVKSGDIVFIPGAFHIGIEQKGMNLLSSSVSFPICLIISKFLRRVTHRG